MDKPPAPKRPLDDQRGGQPSPPGATAPRHRQLIEAAVVASEITAAAVADSRALPDYARQVVGRPHLVVAATPADTPAPRQVPVCERCGSNIDTPGIAIMRGRMVMHVRCDWRASA